MTLNFPTDPGAQSPVNTYGPDSTPLSTDNGVLYTWDGDKWVANKQISYDGRYVNVTGDTMTGDLTVPNLVSQGDVDGVNGDFSGNITAANLPTNGSIVGYQQGVWTPGFVAGANMGTGIINIACSWSRVGNLVTIWINLRSSDATGNTAVADQIQVNGLPYDIDESENNSIPFLAVQTQGRVNNSQWWGSIFWDTTAPETQLTFRAFNLVNTNPRTLPLRATMTYLTDDTTWTPINGATVD